MSVETKFRHLAAGKVRVVVTRRRRGPFILVRPDGTVTERHTRKEALASVSAVMRCMNNLQFTMKRKDIQG